MWWVFYFSNFFEKAKHLNNILDSRKVSWLDFFILYVQVPAKSRIGYQSPGATGSCVLPNMSAGNWTLEE